MFSDIVKVLSPVVRYFAEKDTKRKAVRRLRKAERDYTITEKEIAEKQNTLAWLSTEIINARSALRDIESGLHLPRGNSLNAPARSVISGILAGREAGR